MASSRPRTLTSYDASETASSTSSPSTATADSSARSLHNAFARWFQDWATEKFGFGLRDIAAWMKAEKEAAEGPEAPENAKSCEPEGPQDLTGRLSHGR
jgi:hypothetical protein